jgi:thiol-disulfide isomerase/thioredoxin
LLLAEAVAATVVLHADDFDRVLRAHRRALVLFHAPWCAHCRALAPTFEALVGAFDGTVLFARVSSDGDGNHELLDRFDVNSYPALLWYDGTTAWPPFASEAKPDVYRGEHTFEPLATFVEQRGRLRRRVPPPAAPVDEPSPPPPPRDPPPFTLPRHACTDLSAAYVECLRHRKDRQDLCARERHEYVMCMSGKWAVPAPDHASMARAFASFDPRPTTR